MHAITDVTGFGLLGHALEMARGSGVTLDIRLRARSVSEPGGVARRDGFHRRVGAQLGELRRRRRASRRSCRMAACAADRSANSGGLLVACAAERADRSARRSAPRVIRLRASSDRSPLASQLFASLRKPDGGREWEFNPPGTVSLPHPDLKSGRPTGDVSLPKADGSTYADGAEQIQAVLVDPAQIAAPQRDAVTIEEIENSGSRPCGRCRRDRGTAPR